MSPLRRRPALAVLVGLALLDTAAGGLPAAGQDAGSNPARNYFTDVALVDQDGRELRFYSDLLAGKKVVIGTFYTTCSGACPVLNKSMQKIQGWLGDRLGKDVVMLSITVDAARDTPPRMKEFARELGARPGWHFLSGAPGNVDLALAKLGSAVEQPEDHNNLIFVGNEPTGLWKKAFGLAPSEELIPIVESVLEDQF